MHRDIIRCDEAQAQNEGSYELYQALVGKYNGMFNDFEKCIPRSGKAAALGSAYNYRSELNAIKEKLEFIIATEAESNPLVSFKLMFQQDLDNLNSAVHDTMNRETPPIAKSQLYQEITAKYHTIVPKLGDGLYGYIDTHGFYDEVIDDSLIYNLNQLFHRLTAFKATGFAALKTNNQNVNQPLVQVNNHNQNSNSITITIDQVIKQIEKIPSTTLSDEEKSRLTTDLYTLEGIKSTGDKKRFWDTAKEVLKFIADKGADAAIVAIPLILQGLQ